jgi:hypothetical protein
VTCSASYFEGPANDLKAWFRGRKYVVETLKLLSERLDSIFIDQVVSQMAELGRVGIAVLAYLFLIRVCRDELRPGQSWSVAHLQHVFRLGVITNQVEHNVKAKFGRGRNAA